MITEVLACPVCGARLFDGAELRCSDCGARYPVLAGVPILVPDPGAWLGSYKDAVLASLAEQGLADPETVQTVLEWAEPGQEVRAFGDDWTEGEVVGVNPTTTEVGGASWRAFLAEVPDIHALLANLVEGKRVLELGCGVGALSRLLARPGLVVADLSLRAILRARQASGAPGVVLDADHLALVPGGLDSLVAANLWDLLDQPDVLAEAVAIGLDEGGCLVLSTPDPSDLTELLEAQGLDLDVDHEAVPWLRSHGPRHTQVYWVRVVRAR